MQCSVTFVQQSLVYSGGTTVSNGGSPTVLLRFVYRIFEYSFVLGIFDSLGFRIFVLALKKSQWPSNVKTCTNLSSDTEAQQIGLPLP